MANHPADWPFRLDSLPELWGMARMVHEFRADDQTIRRWVREGRLRWPCLRRGSRAFWHPADIEPYQQRRLRRIRAE
jgi:predicted site-specific integrase-resolvase